MYDCFATEFRDYAVQGVPKKRYPCFIFAITSVNDIYDA